MRIQKRLVCPERVRRVPLQFSWVDHRLVRDERLSGCRHAAWALYLFLVTVADAEGLSYYAEHSLQCRLTMSAEELATARTELLRAGLIAYEAPLYQVLALDRPLPVVPRRSGGTESVSIGEVLQGLMLGGAR